MLPRLVSKSRKLKEETIIRSTAAGSRLWQEIVIRLCKHPSELGTKIKEARYKDYKKPLVQS